MKSFRDYLNIIEQLNESPIPMVGGVEFAENDECKPISLADADCIGGDDADDLIADVDTKERPMHEDDEDENPSSRLQSIILHRIMMQHPALLQQYGPAAVMDAAAEEAEFYGDYDELGTSDISALVNKVAQTLEHTAGTHQVPADE